MLLRDSHIQKDYEFGLARELFWGRKWRLFGFSFINNVCIYLIHVDCSLTKDMDKSYINIQIQKKNGLKDSQRT